MYTGREPYLATTGADSYWLTWHNSTVLRSHHRQTRSNGAEGWKDASEDNKWMIVQCATFSKSLNPRNIDKSVSDIRISIPFPFVSSFWITLCGCKLAILLDIKPANRIVIISGAWAGFWIFWTRTPAASGRIRVQVFLTRTGFGLELDFVICWWRICDT